MIPKTFVVHSAKVFLMMINVKDDLKHFAKEDEDGRDTSFFRSKFSSNTEKACKSIKPFSKNNYD